MGASLVHLVWLRDIVMRFVLIPELGGRWSWVLRNSNGEAVCQSQLSFGTREKAIAAIQEFRLKVGKAQVFNCLGAPIDS